MVFQGETREFGLKRHREQRPEHAGRSVRFEHRNQPRTEIAEMFAAHTPEELLAVIDRIEAKGRGKPIGEQILADVHGWGNENHLPRPSRLTCASDTSAQLRHFGF